MQKRKPTSKSSSRRRSGSRDSMAATLVASLLEDSRRKMELAALRKARKIIDRQISKLLEK